MFLKKQLPGDTVWCTHKRYRPSLEMFQHQGRDQRVIADNLDLGNAARGIDHPFGMGHFQR